MKNYIIYFSNGKPISQIIENITEIHFHSGIMTFITIESGFNYTFAITEIKAFYEA